MSPQRSNRAALIEGTIRCLERLPPEQVTARAIAAESRANLASITYHFGSKDNLVTEALVTGLDRWLAEVAAGLDSLPARAGQARMRRAWEVVEATRGRHTGLAATVVLSLAKAQHDEEVRALLAEGFRKTRPAVAALLGLREDQSGLDAAGLVLSMFYGLLFQVLLDPQLAIDGRRMDRGLAELRTVLPGNLGPTST